MAKGTKGQNGKKREGIHVVGVDVESLHRLRLARVRLKPGEGGLVRVTGKNRAGKTSLLTAIKEAFGGAGEVTAVPIHDGADAGFVRIELDNGFTITRRITESNPKGYLSVIAPDGGKHGQAKLNEWLGPHSFDPLAFFTLKPERQREILFSIGKDPDLHSKIDALREERQTIYDQRTPHNSEKQRCERVKQPEGERPEPVDISAEMEELRRLQGIERQRGDLERGIRSASESIFAMTEAAAKAEGEIARLEAELEKAKAELATLDDRHERLVSEAEGLRAELAAIPDVVDDLQAVQERMSQADAVTKSLEPWTEYDRAQESLKAAAAEAKKLTEQLNEKKAEELRLLAAAEIPVPGLSFDPETAEPMLDGFPLALASGGERIRTSVAVALAVDPDLRICLVDEANDLDLDALEELERLGQEHAFQVFACRIGLESAGEIVIEDGEARTAETAEASG